MIETREQKLMNLKRDLCQLYSLLELDSPTLKHEMRDLGRSIEYGVRYITEDYNYKTTPILDGLRARIPLGEPITLMLYSGQEEDRHERIHQCVIQQITGYCEGCERITFEVVRRRCRKPERKYYHAFRGQGLTIWRGYVDPARTSAKPLYDFEKS
ncbi:hypothetical protein [Deinococcus cellulosilyticus]|uniref:Uncharacterized protein n=1 Tax=Deinococcus cellulosilyticus (strain DSM 18568 / NBRC 106333 / KACC 11606 / 5516J-15) TaxID=1223518 RepID=A0A511NAW9_DEIC1|nr:hypothetical protein [Deinococcus cellulosilyticus]GEM49658.1 hypothetical protein DC3_52930 [Deinococcus cellulosilyticus NBRC 106333 = KACC 11606]